MKGEQGASAILPKAKAKVSDAALSGEGESGSLSAGREQNEPALASTATPEGDASLGKDLFRSMSRRAAGGSAERSW